MPNIEDARPSCEGADVELVQWDLENPSTLATAFEGCTASLLVPPIHNRIEIIQRYLRYSV